MSLSNCNCVRAVPYILFTMSISFCNVSISADHEGDCLHEPTKYRLIQKWNWYTNRFTLFPCALTVCELGHNLHNKQYIICPPPLHLHIFMLQTRKYLCNITWLQMSTKLF